MHKTTLLPPTKRLDTEYITRSVADIYAVRHPSTQIRKRRPHITRRAQHITQRSSLYNSTRPTIVCERTVINPGRTITYQTKAIILTGHGTYISDTASKTLPTLTTTVTVGQSPENLIAPVLIPFGPAVQPPTGSASDKTTTIDKKASLKNQESPVKTRKKPRTHQSSTQYELQRHQPKTAVVTCQPLQTAPLLPHPSCNELPGAPLLATVSKRKMALLLPGHNEELIIATTIRSAIAAGQDPMDIYVVDDNSSDQTRRLAIEQLSEAQVLTVPRSGKAGAVQKAIAHFDIEDRYEWLHVADADSIFSADYFNIYRQKLDSSKYAVAVGFVQSLRGNWISTYRALCYTYSQHIFRRIQAKLGMISVFPGPITSFRTDVLRQLDFNTSSLTEDFDITLQVHRKRLGGIVFIPRAINYTQDPQNLRDFCKQSMRWYRGFFQGVKTYRIGLHGQRIDVSIGFQLLQIILVVVQLGVLVPWFIISTGNWMIIPVAFCFDLLITAIVTLASAIAIKRWNLMGALPYFYFLRYLEVAMYYYAFVEIMILKRFSTEMKGWATEGRRYKVHKAALQDTAV